MKKKFNIPPKANPLINPDRPDYPLGGENSQRLVKARSSGKNKAGHPRKQADTLHELETQNGELARARTMAEEAYRQYTDLYDFAPVGYFTLGRAGAIRQVNLAGANLLGIEHAKLINRRLGRFVTQESRSVFGAFLKELASCEGKATCEVAFKKKGEHPLWARIEATCLEGGQESRAVLMDITERKKVEEALQKSEWRNRIVSELTTDYVFIVDVIPGGGLRLAWASDSMLRMTGRTIEDAETPDLWKNIVHPDDNARFFEFANQILTTAEAGQLECRSLDKNGKERWILILARPQIGEGNRVASIVGAIKDVTERKQAEEALRESREKFQAIADYTVDWESWFGPDGKYLWVNPGVEEVTGYSATEILAMPDFISTIVMDEDRNNFTERFLEAIHGSRGNNFEFRYLHKNGTKRWLSISWQPIYDAKGGPLGTRASGRDITERKQMENELRHTKESLKTMNIELQDALAHEKQLAHIDSLTGINNRRRLYELAEYEFEIAARYRQPLSVMMFDIDHFKRVNDTFGHAAGDQILQIVTQAASAELRSADVIGRYGGEEFVIILPMTNAQQAYPLAERIRKRVAALHVQTENGDATVTLSTGIVEMRHNAQVESAEYLIRRADEAMYAAKQAGRNRTQIGNP